jgi:hypothetical protein
VFLPCEVGPFSNVLSVLITHVTKFRLNLLINPPGSLLTLNVWDVIFIWASDRDIINLVKEEPELSIGAFVVCEGILCDAGPP